MEKFEYAQYGETVYSEVLDNGLTVRILPKKDYLKTYALFSTQYGSIDNAFVPRGQKEMVKVPDGIAHFLEHKLFEKEEGDVFQLFGKQAASSNAYTSFTNTAYLFSAIENVDQNLETLIDFVQDPYFTEESVNKEKGIIAQEIQMYDDEPSWRLFFGLLENLFPDNPVSIDIAGTVESIQDITADWLYTCYNTFYHPSNMVLTIVGQVDPDHVMDLIRDNQAKKNFSAVESIERQENQEDLSSIVKKGQINMAVQQPKVIAGIRGQREYTGSDEDYKYAQTVALMMRLLFGQTSQTYLDLYNEGIIDDSFGYGSEFSRGYNYLSVYTDASHPEESLSRLKQVLINAKESPELKEENFEMIKKRMIGQNLMALNSVEALSRNLYFPDEGGKTIFDLMPIVETITLDDVKRVSAEYINEDLYSEFTILPNEG